ncbi:MAG TPA: nucleotidyltransferase [Candidatus Limnocylindrales bacterium]|nr:nucleotidyltransferase [Candidatus Limnocylindrales bacterium]
MKINSDYSDLLRVFAERGVRYLIAGSYASMKYTEPIWSKDIDVWVEPVPENAAKVLDALRHFGAPIAGIEAEEFVNPTTIFQIGVEGVRIDIMTNILGLNFEEAWARRDTFLLNDATHPVLSIHDAIKAAEASGRAKDRSRVRALKKAAEMRNRSKERP